MNKLNDEQKLALFLGVQFLALFLSFIFVGVFGIFKVGVMPTALWAFFAFFFLSAVFFLRRP